MWKGFEPLAARRFGLWTAFWPVVALSVYGGVRLFQLRFETGDVYPEYSSLRSDPLGARVFYQSLEQVGNMEVSRNTLPFSRLSLDAKRTLVLAGFSHSYWLEDPAWLMPIEHLLGSGSRVVICFYPYEGQPSAAKDQKDATKPEDAGGRKRSEEEIALRKRKVALGQRWGVELETKQAANSKGKPRQHSTVSLQSGTDLPETLSWHSQLSFRKLSPDWRVIYRREDKPVLIERPFGSGTLVLASDSYFLSNEALWKERQPRLLSWLIGQHHQVVFDETHLGVRENPGVVSLLRKYRLHGLFAGLFLLAGLFVWKNMSSLVPPATSAEAAEIHVGRDSAAGFVNLLRRSVPVSTVISVCVRQWEKSLPASSPERARVSQVRALMAETESGSTSHAVSTYQAICKVLEGKSSTGREQTREKES
ncbi:MAG: hypothetical protein DMG08_23435 [Acidobacteria bacterium]|nr:MAG: hypothetical protein DMG08_23435 [Acidobacteriota bacterium]